MKSNKVELNNKKPLDYDLEVKITKTLFLKLLKTSPTLIFSASNFGEINYNDQIIKNILDNPDQFNQDFKDGKIGAIDILKINTSFLNNNKEILNEIYDSYDGYLNNKENLLDFLNIVSNDFYNGDTETFYQMQP